jgi:hypothetical protein
MNTCRRCSECEGAKHHWNCEPDWEVSLADEAWITCKHCDLKVEVNADGQTFIETSDGSHTFFFLCEGCGAEGMLSVQADRVSDRVWCPDKCGATYVLWHNPLKNQPDLMCVVKPVFAEAPV